MALIKCKKCGQEFSNENKFCPQCGTKFEDSSKINRSNLAENILAESMKENSQIIDENLEIIKYLIINASDMEESEFADEKSGTEENEVDANEDNDYNNGENVIEKEENK